MQARIDQFAAVDLERKETFEALRIVGNLGTHESEVGRTVLLDAFELYEHALDELYGQKKAKIDALRKKIIALKGKY